MLATAVWMVGRALRSPSWHPVPVTRRDIDSAVDPGQIALPASILPSDGRFGCGPSKVRAGQIDAIVAGARNLIGTSHRKPPVKNLVGSIRAGLRELFALPEGWEIMLGNGGTTVFWDAASFALVDRRSQHLAFGEFSTKFAEVCRAAPHLDEPAIITSPAGDHPDPVGEAGVDLYALTHNETSTGVAMQLRRPSGSDTGSLVAVDATSAAGGLRWDTEEVDVYYFAPQKCFASDGGLWISACAPAAIERIDRLASGHRWIPASIDLGIAIENSRLDQTYNTPAVATLIMLDDQIRWMNAHGGLEWCAARSDESASIVYAWAEKTEWASPFVGDSAKRSSVVATIDLDASVSAEDVCTALRANGIVDTDGYRKLGRNQLRIGMFPAIDPADVEALTLCIDAVVVALQT
jgi:phosphoserine aminotransferase